MGGEDELDHVVPWLVVLGGGVGEERLDLACHLFSWGNGNRGVVLTGTNMRRIASDRTRLVRRCGVPNARIHEWSTTADTFEELLAVANMLSADPFTSVIVVSDTLHMPRLRYVRDRLSLNGRVYLRQSRLGRSSEPDGSVNPPYVWRVFVFWFREPLAYVFYRFRY